MNSAKPRKTSKLKSFEDNKIIGTARYARFQEICSTAGLLAIKDAKSRGLPITFVRNEEIIKKYADGKEEKLGRIKPDVKVKKRVYRIP
jgi:hypothetical protein